MVTPLLALPASLAEWGRIAAVALLVALVTAPLAYCEGKDTAEAEYRVAVEKANREALEEKARADGLAAERRLTDHIAVTEQERDLIDAISDTPDEAPDAVRVRLGCARLRAAGTSEADIPAVCRSGG